MNRGTEIALIILIIIFIGGGLWWWHENSVKTGNVPLGGTSGHTQVGTRSGYLNDNGQYYAAKASYPLETPIQGTLGVSAVDTMKAFAQNQITTFKLQNHLDTLTPEDIKMLGLDQDRKYALDITFETYTAPSSVSYVFKLYEDTLGAHPNGYYRTFTWDTKTGKLLTLESIIKTPDYLQKLSAISREVLAKKLGEGANTDMLNAGTTPDEDNFQTFAVAGNTLQIIFPPYQVGPYAIGTQTVTIPLSELTATTTKPIY